MLYGTLYQQNMTPTKQKKLQKSEYLYFEKKSVIHLRSNVVKFN